MDYGGTKVRGEHDWWVRGDMEKARFERAGNTKKSVFELVNQMGLLIYSLHRESRSSGRVLPDPPVAVDLTCILRSARSVTSVPGFSGSFKRFRRLAARDPYPVP